MAKTIFRHKVFLVLFGLFLTVVLLEAGLRVAGIIFLKVQEHSKRISIKRRGEYRILCLGESTTILGGRKSYPMQLEDILNSNQGDIKFTVVNKGIPSISTMHIISHLEKYLDKYKPHIVIVMMGVNDSFGGSVGENTTPSPWAHSLEWFRTYKLAKFVVTYLFHDGEEIKEDPLDKDLKKWEFAIKREPSVGKFTKLAGIYRALNRPEKEKEAILKALELDPGHYEAMGFLGLYYKRYGEYDKAIQAFKKALQENRDKPAPRDFKILAYAHLAECYKLQGKDKQAEEVYLKAIRYLPRHPGAYGGLGELYLNQGRYGEAETLLQKQLRINPHAVLFYGKLAHCYRRKGRGLAAEKLLKEAIKINPEAMVLHKELGAYLLENKKYQEAGNVLERALELNKKQSGGSDIDIYNLLLANYEGQSKVGEALKIKEFLRSQKGNYNPQTRRNYQKLKEILLQRGIQLIAVQYPLRALDSLKSMLHPAGDIIFVDNEEIFKEAIALESYDDYFFDRFAGDFGHCTPKGNRLIAENVAGILLESGMR